MLEWLTPDPLRQQRDDGHPAQTHGLLRLISQAGAAEAEARPGLENRQSREP
tara:strand:+ start:374 stop:529 length:156 start_codon:yes stop_codon:yes gene_type:complete